MTNREVVTAFFTNYQKHNPEGMHACLAPGVEFCDLAYKSITGPDVFAMWRWFCRKTETRKEIEVPGFDILSSEGDRVSAEYWVRYSPAPGKLVNYVIRSEFTLSNGAIVRQVDKPVISVFEFARMAKGFPLCLLALTPAFKIMTRKVMRQKLDDSKAPKAAAGSGG